MLVCELEEATQLSRELSSTEEPGDGVDGEGDVEGEGATTRMPDFGISFGQVLFRIGFGAVGGDGVGHGCTSTVRGSVCVLSWRSAMVDMAVYLTVQTRKRKRKRGEKGKRLR